MTGLGGLVGKDFCYVTTKGRKTGQPHDIEIWFALNGSTLYMLSGGRDRSDWVKNIRAHPEVRVRIGSHEFAGQARVVKDPKEDGLARRLLLQKYSSGYAGDLTGWGRTALAVAVDLRTETGRAD